MEKVLSKSQGFKKTFYILIILAMLLALIAPLATSAVWAEEGPLLMHITNDTDEDYLFVKDWISLTDERVFTVTVPVKTGDEIDVEKVTWTLARTKGIMDAGEYPNQFSGGNMATDWKVNSVATANAGEAFFELGTAEIVDDTLQMVFSNKLMFGIDNVNHARSVNKIRNRFLDYIGDYTLSCVVDGQVYDSCEVRVNPYDSYRAIAMDEYTSDMNAAVKAAKENGLYAEVKYLNGTSAGGLDMPYIVIADSKASLDAYDTFKVRAENDPAALIADIESGKANVGDLRMPVLFNNVHPDETDGSDALMNFMWLLVNNEPVEYRMIYELTTGGQAKLTAERAEKGLNTSALYGEWFTFFGAVKGNDAAGKTNTVSTAIEMEGYYNLEGKVFDPEEMLASMFFIICPNENPDGKMYNTRTNCNGFDLNRDGMFQTQSETRAITEMIAYYNPISMVELHGFVEAFQIEPCTPPHAPNIEYDLLIEHNTKASEALGNAAVSSSRVYNSYEMTNRDFFVTDEDGKAYWAEPWDDMTTNYTPQYAGLHGTMGNTVEVPEANEAGTDLLTYGLMGHCDYLMNNKKVLIVNQLKIFERCVNNTDADEMRKFFVDAYDTPGAEANLIRPRSEENNNYFPEYYIIPMDVENQRNLDAAYEMEAFFVRNGVKVSVLDEDVTVKGTTYKKGAMVLDMYQAKRAVISSALYDGVLLTEWDELYSEPITSFHMTRGFDCDEIRVKDAFKNKTTLLTSARTPQGAYVEKSDEVGVVVIMNNSVDAIAAVNELLQSGDRVGYIQNGDYATNFAVSPASYDKVKNNFVLTAYGTVSVQAAEIKNPTLYLAGRPAQLNFGFVDYDYQYGNYTYRHQEFAFVDQLGFVTTSDAAKADVILVNRTIGEAELAALTAQAKAGVPIIVMGANSTLAEIFEAVTADAEMKKAADDGLAFTANGIYDALTTVTYADANITVDSYRETQDFIMYGYGGNCFTSLPQGANALIIATKEDPMEGFISADALKTFKGSVLAFDYIEGEIDITAFANTLAHKAHQQDDYRYATNTIYGKMLGEVVVFGEGGAPPTGDGLPILFIVVLGSVAVLLVLTIRRKQRNAA